MDALYAREEFRIGVQAFNRFNFNEAILLFENALRYRPGEALILEWLGRAYYRSGFEEAAIAIWQASAAAYGYSSRMGMLLSSKIETLRIRRSLLPVADDAVRYVESGRFVGRSGDLVLYRQPSAVLPREDGTTWVVAYGSNELLRIDVNGIIRDRKRGPLYGFDRPYDLARGPDGKLFLSEFRGGRVSVLSAEGDWQYYIGSKGIGPGQFMGPQNLAVDDEGYLYVVDFGNRRVSKFDPSGTFIASFGKNSANAEVLKFPTGIAVADGIVYVADKYSRSIHTFDRNGAYLGVFISEGLVGPESLRLLSDGRLLVTDTNRFLLVDPDTAIVRELGVIGNISAVRVTGSDIDRNGSILAADFKNGEVSILTRIEDKAAGLFVKIDRIVADEFPLVKAEILVQDRLRRPVVGLDQRNFLLTEYGSPVGGLNFLGASNLSTLSDAAIFIERSAESAARRDDLAAAVRDIGASGMRLVSLVSAGERPTKENLAASGGVSPARALEEAARGSASAYSPRWRFDLGLRLAATDLLAGEKSGPWFLSEPGSTPQTPRAGLGRWLLKTTASLSLPPTLRITESCFTPFLSAAKLLPNWPTFARKPAARLCSFTVTKELPVSWQAMFPCRPVIIILVSLLRFLRITAGPTFPSKPKSTSWKDPAATKQATLPRWNNLAYEEPGLFRATRLWWRRVWLNGLVRQLKLSNTLLYHGNQLSDNPCDF
uniref:NHL repeat containing protein n=1 Tax=uncultured bacterium contig00033 TaxID=1181522 RepID=A0A806KIY8_9BACT|nr:hypothetical protein [uncultured bacterium contig00033]